MITRLNKLLEGQPEQILTMALVGAAIIAILVAIFGSPTLKLAVAAWIIAP